MDFRCCCCLYCCCLFLVLFVFGVVVLLPLLVFLKLDTSGRQQSMLTCPSLVNGHIRYSFYFLFLVNSVRTKRVPGEDAIIMLPSSSPLLVISAARQSEGKPFPPPYLPHVLVHYINVAQCFCRSPIQSNQTN